MSIQWMGLLTGASALRAFQEALGVVQHNLANADTEGYTRQRANLSPIPPAYTADGMLGRGVEVGEIQQLRDQFIDLHFRQETRTGGQWEAKEKIYRQMQTIVGEPSDNALSSLVSDFWAGWQNLANDPTSLSTRSNLRAKAGMMTEAFNQMDSRLQSLQSDVNEEIKSKAISINNMADQIAEVNRQIRSIESEGVTANDLRDRRNLLIDNLNKIINVTVYESQDHTVNVSINGVALVESTRTHAVEAVARPGDPLGRVDLQWQELQDPVTAKDGTLAGLIEMRDTVIPEYRAGMDTLAKGIIDRVNTLHRTGVGLDGTKQITGGKDFTGTLAANGSFSLNGSTINVFTGDDLATVAARINTAENTTGVHAGVQNSRLVLTPSATNPQTIQIGADPDGVLLQLGIVNNFFAGTGAGDLSLDPVIQDDLNMIAASQGGMPGDNRIAAAIAGLKDMRTMLGGNTTFSEYYNASAANLGVRTDEAIHASESQQMLLSRLDAIKQSTSGVSVDEEMTKMLMYQRGYEAAARFISVVDGLLNTLINGTMR